MPFRAWFGLICCLWCEKQDSTKILFERCRKMFGQNMKVICPKLRNIQWKRNSVWTILRNAKITWAVRLVNELLLNWKLRTQSLTIAEQNKLIWATSCKRWTVKWKTSSLETPGEMVGVNCGVNWHELSSTTGLPGAMGKVRHFGKIIRLDSAKKFAIQQKKFG